MLTLPEVAQFVLMMMEHSQCVRPLHASALKTAAGGRHDTLHKPPVHSLWITQGGEGAA